MGQRNATYIIVEKKGSDVKHIKPIYNQWNYIGIQASKMQRGIEGVISKNWHNLAYTDSGVIANVYHVFSGINSFDEDGKELTQWVGGYDESKHYSDDGYYNTAYQEDNNNGWNLVKFIVGDDSSIEVQIFCVIGSEDKHYDGTDNDTLENYFTTSKDKESVEYLKQFAWNPELEGEAKELLEQLVKENSKQVN